jgi:predicted  nucleic acid-binding Zn-ribbon protein
VTTTFVGADAVQPESYLEARQYRVTYECERCGHTWKRTYSTIPKKDPPCPKVECIVARSLEDKQREVDNLRQMLESQTAPAQVGANVQVRAVDETAKVVMEDYGMTNLKDNVRQGESVAPTLAPEQQRQADNYFGSKGSVPVITAPGEKRATMRAAHMHALGRRAMAGAFANMAVPPTAIVPDAVAGQPALTRVRTENLR